jgi:hypothetical protein
MSVLNTMDVHLRRDMRFGTPRKLSSKASWVDGNNIRLTYSERVGLLREEKEIQLLFRKDKSNCGKKH